MFTTWEQIRGWIEDNNFPHWVFYKQNPDETDSKANTIIVDSNNFTVSDFGDKLAMTEKYLRMYGNKVYGVGFKTPNTTVGGVVCEARIMDETPAQGVNGAQQITPFTIGEIEERVRKQIRAELREEDYNKRLAELEKRENAFKEKEESTWGTIIGYLAPYGQQFLQRKMMPKVAGIDSEGDVHAARIVPTDAPGAPEAHEPEEQSPFTDEEADELFALLAEFKRYEPDYMQLLRAVVKMAKSGDSTYTMAKGFLVK